jgi:SAM-dependent methyltransferase
MTSRGHRKQRKPATAPSCAPDLERSQRLASFVSWVRQCVTGDEKGQAQIFLDRLFIAFGQKGSLDVGGAPEFRVKKSADDGGGTSFADYVWKPIVLIEMKKRGVDLSRHYRQAFDYWTRLVPNRPRYVVLCNFDEFHIYDFDRQIDDPVDTVTLEDLPERWGPLAFLYPTQEAPQFANDRESVTREAADNLARCFNLLIDANRRGGPVPREMAQRFILQMLVSLFAEDIDLLPKYIVARLLDEVKSPADSFDILGGLFEAMNRPPVPGSASGNPGGRYKGVDYFNGGLFAVPAKLELTDAELAQLKAAAKSNWSKVSPDIFGTLFEHSLGKEDRHAFGAHYTSPIDIMKIVRPTIVDPWTAAIESAKSLKDLRDLLDRLRTLRVLDPACGSGNFLYMAYRELKRLEARLIERTREFKSIDPAQQVLGFVTARQFFGMDINPFAIELAKVTMMIARKLAIDELHITESALPLDNLDQNFRCVDALMTDGQRTAWPPADVIIGNPPFLGAKRLKPERGADYVNAVRRLYPEVPGMADYCVYWIRRSHDHLPACTPQDPFAGRAGLVGTQNIRNNQSRVGGLDHVAASGTIVEAVDNQPWSGEANVHVSIANWVKLAPGKSATVAGVHPTLLLPANKRLWCKVESAKGGKRILKGQRADKTYELQDRECITINSALSDEAPVNQADVLNCNIQNQVSFQGVVPGYEGFAVEARDCTDIIRQQSNCRTVIRPWMIGRDVLTGDGTPTRKIVDFADWPMNKAQEYGPALRYLQQRVLPAIQESARISKDNMKAARAEHLGRWWQFWNVRTEMRLAFRGKRRYLACSRVTKRPIFVFASTEIVPDGALQVWSLDDDYSFGVIQSVAHWEWFFANCSKLKSDYRYTRRSVWDTFPWPQGPDFVGPCRKDVAAVAAAGRELRRVRAEVLAAVSGGLRSVYRTLELPGKHPLKDAHSDLDAAVIQAYGFNRKQDLLQQLLELNHAIASREKRKESVVSPGIPICLNGMVDLVSSDCIM